jgi:membrane protein YqaA with SNARE-associated domain
MEGSYQAELRRNKTSDNEHEPRHMTQRFDGVPLVEQRQISGKRWLCTFLGFLFLNIVFLYFARIVPLPVFWQRQVMLLMYMSMAFAFCPLPTIWILLWAAREIDPFSVALVGALGTCVANLNDYHILNYLFKLEKIKRATGTRTYQGAVRWFNKAPFLTLSVASFLPIPIDVIRILSVSAAYPRGLYVLATFAGRFPRYLLITILGHEIKLSNTGILIVLLVTAALGAVKGLSKFREKNYVP